MMKRLHKRKSLAKLFLVLLLLVVTFSYAMFQGGFVSWFLFYSFLPFLLYAGLLGFYSSRGFKVKREISRSEVRAGESVKIRVELERRIAFPFIYLFVVDGLSEELVQSSLDVEHEQFFFPQCKKKLVWEYELSQLPRGEYNFLPIRVKVSDPIGLMEKEVLIACPETLLVYPQMIAINGRNRSGHYDQNGSMAMATIHKDLMLVTGARKYQPGDRFTWIDWKATARTNDMMTKEFDQSDSQYVYVMLDCYQPNHFEQMVTFTASILRTFLQQKAQVGLFINGKELEVLQVNSGEEHLHQMLRYLARQNPDADQPLPKTLSAESSPQRQAGTLLIITSEISLQVMETARKHVRKASAIIIYCMKAKGERLSDVENAAIAQSSAYGVSVKVLDEADFQMASLGVRDC